MIKVNHKGSFSNTYFFLDRCLNYPSFISEAKLNAICQKGLNDLKDATPTLTGETANSWSYELQWIPILGFWRIVYSNSNIEDGVSIAIILDTGHATKNGGWIEGEHYINPSIRPTFEKIIELAWNEITKPVHSRGITL